MSHRFNVVKRLLLVTALAFGAEAGPGHAATAYSTALAQAVSRDGDLVTFYNGNGWAPVWSDGSTAARARVNALLAALANAGAQGLPVARYNVQGLQILANAAKGDAALARMEAAFSSAFLTYAEDVQSGVLNPRSVAPGIERGRVLRNGTSLMQSFVQSDPAGFLASLPPQTDEYRKLVAAKADLDRIAAKGGWGPQVAAPSLAQGQAGPAVQQLRNRLNAMGYAAGRGDGYDGTLIQALKAFQTDHGLSPDGVAGKGTIAEVNMTVNDRRAQVVAALERARWMNFPLGSRYVWVNIPDFTVKIIDNGRVAFQSKVVVGETRTDHQTPEFDNTMQFMVINPTWNVPRSIAVKEYLPMLQANPNAVANLDLLDQNGQKVSRASVNFASYSADNFPFRLKEPPSDGNALGEVKFMFPNPYNIYLHDTPSKALFSRESRAFSHGCVRVHDPEGMAHYLLSGQEADPDGFFKAKVATGVETTVMLKHPLPVHLVYATAFIDPASGKLEFRRDIYGRDAAIYAALRNAGVSL